MRKQSDSKKKCLYNREDVNYPWYLIAQFFKKCLKLTFAKNYRHNSKFYGIKF